MNMKYLVSSLCNTHINIDFYYTAYFMASCYKRQHLDNNRHLYYDLLNSSVAGNCLTCGRVGVVYGVHGVRGKRG